MADKKITYDEYLNIIINKAVEAAKARAEYNKSIWGEQWSKNIDEAILKYAEEYREELKKKKPYKDITEKELSDIYEFPAEQTMQWLDGNFRGDSPWDIEHKMEAAKILPLLLGSADAGKDWYSRTALDLQGIGKKDFGFDTSTPDGFQQFLNKLGEYQQQYDRAQLLKEGQQGLTDYWFSKLLTPSYTQEIENAVATGQGGDPSTLRKLKAIDILSNSAQALAPSATVSKWNPLLMGTIDAIVGQGGAEVARQYAKEAVSNTDQKAELGDALLAASLGATRPGMTLMATGAMNQLPTQFMKDFARGFQKGARTGSSSERSAIKNAIDLYNKDLSQEALKANLGETGSIIDRTGSKYTEALKVPLMARLFGIAADKNGLYDAEKILAMYDLRTKAPKHIYFKDTGDNRYFGTNSAVDLFRESTIPDPDEVVKAAKKSKVLLGKVFGKKPDPNVKNYDPEIILGGDSDVRLLNATPPTRYERYKDLFKEKASELDANPTALMLGRIAGSALADAGSRIEPVVKSNPLKLFNDKGMKKSYTERYKDQPWYKSLNNDAKKVFDELFKDKEE